MKLLTIILLLIMPIITFAQNYGGMSEAEMQKMMQEMKKVESCMRDIDQEKLKALEQRSNQVDAELKSLCANGEREKAQATAMSFGKEIARDPTIQTIRKCSENMKGMMPKMPFIDDHKGPSSHHVCD